MWHGWSCAFNTSGLLPQASRRHAAALRRVGGAHVKKFFFLTQHRRASDGSNVAKGQRAARAPSLSASCRTASIGIDSGSRWTALGSLRNLILTESLPMRSVLVPDATEAELRRGHPGQPLLRFINGTADSTRSWTAWVTATPTTGPRGGHLAHIGPVRHGHAAVLMSS